MALPGLSWNRLRQAAQAAMAGLAQDAAAAAWVATHGRDVWCWLVALGHALGQGGFRISVPQPEPLLETLVQLDGDYVTAVHWDAIAALTAPARQTLLAQHRDALNAWLALNADTVARLVRSARFAKLATWTPLLGVSSAAGVSSLRAWAWAELLTWLPVLAGAMLPLTVRLMVRAALRWGLRRATRT